MHTVPITIRLATKLTKDTHRREPSLTGALWAVGLVIDGAIVGCAVVACPKARLLDSGADEGKRVLEVVRVAVPELPADAKGHKGACSMLYGAVARAARAMGCATLITYTHADEPGTSLRAAGWVRETDDDGAPREFGGGDWSKPSRPRKKRVETGPKHRWAPAWSEPLTKPTEAGERP